MSNTQKTLVVDLDGSLIYTDLFFESLVRAIKKNPFIIFYLPFWLKQGIGFLKAQLAVRAQINIERLPYNQALIQALTEEKNNYDSIVLCTGSNEHYAQQVAKHLNIFDAIHASTTDINLTGRHKGEFLLNEYGEKQFTYVGNELKDYHIWKHALTSWVVTNDQRVTNTAKSCSQLERLFEAPEKPTLKVYLKAMRIHQWVKNLLVFLPLLTAHLLTEPKYLTIGLIAFLTFGLVASATYIINDLFDLDADRSHPKKCHRPLASGALNIRDGILLAAGVIAEFCVWGRYEHYSVLDCT